MATTRENLVAARDAASVKLRAAMEAETSAAVAGAKPNTQAANSVDHGEYITRLLNTIERLDQQIAAEDDRSGGGMVETIGTMF